jgi:hypothetical protein
MRESPVCGRSFHMMNSQRRVVGHRLGIRTFSLDSSTITVLKKPSIKRVFRFCRCAGHPDRALSLLTIFGGTDGLSGYVSGIVVELSTTFRSVVFD